MKKYSMDSDLNAEEVSQGQLPQKFNRIELSAVSDGGGVFYAEANADGNSFDKSESSNLIRNLMGNMRPVTISRPVEIFTSKNFFEHVTERIFYDFSFFSGSEITSLKFSKFFKHESTAETKVREENLIYNLYKPKFLKSQVVVVVLGGSEGAFSFSDFAAKILSNHGFNTVAIPYFKFENLPPSLENIPLEYFERVLNDVSKKLGISEIRFSLVGRSRGAELALLLGSKLKGIKAVAAYAPSNVTWTSGPTNDPSWTIAGKGISSNPHDGRQFDKIVENAEAGKVVALVDWYQQSKITPMSTIFEIEVEKIEGPILLLSGKDDLLWPSESSAELMRYRLMRSKFKYNVQHFTFESVGHCFDVPGVPVFDDDISFAFGSINLSLGGRKRETIEAEYTSWKLLLKFLHSV